MEKVKKPRGFLGWFFRIIVGIVVLVILLALMGTILLSRASASDRAKFTAPGELVTVNDRQMHIYCKGEGSPTVILDAGTGGWSIAWSAIMPDLAETTRVCAYDRAGLGWSEAADDERTPQQMADDLKALLVKANESGPYIMTGFSYTGLSSRLFSAQNPDEVVGLVLVDPTTEFDNELMDETLMRQQRSAIGAYQLFGLAARVGLVRFLNPKEMAPYAPFIPENALEPDIYYSFLTEPLWWQTSQKEFVSRLNDEVLADIRDNGTIRDIPTVVIGSDTIDEGFEALQEGHRAHLQEIASRSSQGEFVLAEGSSHEVPTDRPDVIIVAITKVVTGARAQ